MQSCLTDVLPLHFHGKSLNLHRYLAISDLLEELFDDMCLVVDSPYSAAG